MEDLLLPVGARLVHIGPHKTGTTSLQSAFHAARQTAGEHGVHYAGPNRQPVNAVRAVTGRKDPMAGKAPSLRAWEELAREVRGTRAPRVVLSSEYLSDADDATIPRIVEDLGGASVHVVVTLRPFARIIPSQWQQHVQSGSGTGFEPWLRAVFERGETDRAAKAFWRRHRHDVLIQRWASVVGTERVTAVVLDDRDHGMVMRVFEALTGLPGGTLVPDDDLTNRSMTLPEIETVRAFNLQLLAEGIGGGVRTKLMTFGAGPYMKRRTPSPDEPRVEVPGWALDHAAVVARSIVDGLARSGVRIVGDPAGLLAAPRPAAERAQDDIGLTAEIAGRAAVGVAIASGLARGREPDSSADGGGPEVGAYVPRLSIESPDLVRVSDKQLYQAVKRRIRAGIGRRVHALRRRAAGLRPGIR